MGFWRSACNLMQQLLMILIYSFQVCSGPSTDPSDDSYEIMRCYLPGPCMHNAPLSCALLSTLYMYNLCSSLAIPGSMSRTDTMTKHTRTCRQCKSVGELHASGSRTQ